MCYLCIRDNPFDVTNHLSSSAIKRARAAEIKEILRDVSEGEHSLCDEGEERVERLKDEQYMLSREL